MKYGLCNVCVVAETAHRLCIFAQTGMAETETDGVFSITRDRETMAAIRLALAAGYESKARDLPLDAPTHRWFEPLWKTMVACQADPAGDDVAAYTIRDAFAAFDNTGVALALLPATAQANAVAAGVKPCPMTVSRSRV